MPIQVLVVDNQPENLLSMEAVIAAPGLRVVSARSGHEALKAVLENDFALILMDIQMPGMDGFETAELIRQRERSQHTPIIFVTAINKDAHHMFRGYALGAVDYVFKPFLPEILRSKVGVFVEMHRRTTELEARTRILERANQEMEVFSYSILHDMRFLLDAAARSKEPAAALSELNATLAELADIETGTFLKQTIDLSRLCREAVESLGRSHAGSVCPVWEISVLPPAHGDEKALATAFRRLAAVAARLAGNAEKPVVEIGAYLEENDDLVVFFRANGPGIETKGLAESIDFLRHIGAQEGYRGISLDMAVAQGVAYRMGGSIWINGKQGRGTAFYFKIPAETETAAETPGQVLDEAAAQGQKW